MSKLVLVLAVPALLLPLRHLAATPRRDASADRAAVERAIEDYVLGIYEVAPERIARSVHPALVKRGAYRQPDATDYPTPSLMTFEQLHELAASWNEGGRRGEDLEHSIEVFDVLDVSASAKLTAYWGVDYMHLEKRDGTWKIVHVLWQSHPPRRGG